MPDRTERPLLSRSDNQERSVHNTRESRDSPPDGTFMEPRGCNGWLVTETKEAASEMEAKLLAAYRSEHGQLPPNNRIGGARL